MKCSQIRAMFSAYLDGMASGSEMHAFSSHLEGCAGCRREYALLRETQDLVSSLGRKRAPATLALQLRVALSRELAHARQPRWQGLLVRLENAANAFMFPATAGVMSAVLFFGLLIGFFANPARLEAANDVPLMLYQPPQLASAPFSGTLQSSRPAAVDDDAIVVETYVDAKGRVQDYRIISAPEDEHELRPQLNNMMLFTVFRPATFFGQPTTGRVVISFSRINVQG